MPRPALRRPLLVVGLVTTALAVLVVLMGTMGSGTPAHPTADGVPAELPDHGDFTRVLDRVVQMPLVDYQALQDDRTALDAYIARLGAVSEAELAEASRAEQLAFWINAYNACMLQLVIDHYPIEAGRAGLFGGIRNRVAGYPDNSVWQIRDVFSRNHCHVAGRDRSQDEIEHDIIRPEFDEPRIHFAVNCAAVSCPVLWPMAYEAATLDEELDRAVRHLMAGHEHFRIEPGEPAVLRLNRVMDWYSGDFGGAEGLKAFFADYLPSHEAEVVLRPDTRVEFFEYDWTLNDVTR
ncbi:MAG: DUF547 domain-containing protein [Gemmatimonadales bacterium]|nr:MAG: DUF547 domain-containing protein [Gemmatimonadales bacterium]